MFGHFVRLAFKGLKTCQNANDVKETCKQHQLIKEVDVKFQNAKILLSTEILLRYQSWKI